MRKLKRWQIPLFAFASFGPCMLSTIISVYLVDALQVAGFGSDVEQWTFAAKTIVAVGLFSVLKAISSLMDGLVEVPVATFVQNLKTPWGRKRPAILVGTIVMTLSYVLFCFPGASDGKESPCNEGDLGSIPGLGKSPGGGHRNPLQYSFLENPHGQRSLGGYSPCDCKE